MVLLGRSCRRRNYELLRVCPTQSYVIHNKRSLTYLRVLQLSPLSETRVTRRAGYPSSALSTSSSTALADLRSNDSRRRCSMRSAPPRKIVPPPSRNSPTSTAAAPPSTATIVLTSSPKPQSSAPQPVSSPGVPTSSSSSPRAPSSMESSSALASRTATMEVSQRFGSRWRRRGRWCGMGNLGEGLDSSM